MHYSYKEYEGRVFRIALGQNLMAHQVELYRKGIGYIQFSHPTLILMQGYPISEKEAKSKITSLIMQR